MLRLVLKISETLKGFSSNAQLSSWRKNFSLSQVRTSLFRFMAIVSYPAAVHLSKEPSFPFLVMPSLVLAGCNLLPLKPSLLQAEKPSPPSLSSRSKCSDATPSRCPATQLTPVYWSSANWGRGGKTRHRFPDMSKECGGRGIIPSLDLLGVLLSVPTRRLLVFFAAGHTGSRSAVCRQGATRAGCSLRARRPGAELRARPGGAGLLRPVSVPHYQSEGSGPVWRWDPASDTAWWRPGRSVVTKAGPRSSWEVGRGVAGPSIGPSSAGLWTGTGRAARRLRLEVGQGPGARASAESSSQGEEGGRPAVTSYSSFSTMALLSQTALNAATSGSQTQGGLGSPSGVMTTVC